VAFNVGSLLTLLVPCYYYTSQLNFSNETTTSVCDLGNSREALAGILLVYIISFLLFSYRLRRVADGFHIKNELKFTGLVVILALIPWVLFNTNLQAYNLDFPYSTLSLVLALIFVFYGSTFWPLFRSIYKPPKIIDTQLPDNLDNLSSVIGTQEGFEAFRKFLVDEFSVENLLFYVDIEDIRKKIGEGANLTKVKSETTRLYQKYIMIDSPFQVNISDTIVKSIQEKMEILERDGTVAPPTKGTDEEYIGGKRIDHPTVFDEGERSIYLLMETDSFPRFKTSEYYRQYVNFAQEVKHKKSVLKEMNII